MLSDMLRLNERFREKARESSKLAATVSSSAENHCNKMVAKVAAATTITITEEMYLTNHLLS